MKTIVRGIDINDLVVYAGRVRPSCGQEDCDRAENPSHWVDVLPSKKLEAILDAARDVVAILDACHPEKAKQLRAALAP